MPKDKEPKCSISDGEELQAEGKRVLLVPSLSVASATSVSYFLKASVYVLLRLAARAHCIEICIEAQILV